VKKRQIIVHLFVPANQDAPKAIHPTMRALYDPPSGFEARPAFEGLRFFPAGADVGRKAKLSQRVPHLRIVVALVQTHPLRMVFGRPWPFHDQALYGLLDQFHVMPVGSCHGQADGDSVCFG